MATPLRKVGAPSGPDVDAKFADAVAYRFYGATKSSPGVWAASRLDSPPAEKPASMTLAA